MNKEKLGKMNYMYPSPVVLVGTQSNGTPNYITVTFCSLISKSPAMIMISISKNQLSRENILKTKKYSVNIPSLEMTSLVDYCGLVSGRDIDKSLLFRNFYGDLNVPMIEECPVNLECELDESIELEGTNTVFIGRIVQTYSNKDVLTNAHPDISKINPIVFSMYDYNYWSIGNFVGKAWNIGKTGSSKA